MKSGGVKSGGMKSGGVKSGGMKSGGMKSGGVSGGDQGRRVGSGRVGGFSKTSIHQDGVSHFLVMVTNGNILSVEGEDVWQSGEDTENLTLQTSW